MIGKKRIQWLDLAKGITIFFVLFGHVIDSTQRTIKVNNSTLSILNFLVFTFIMPCFFAISGYLYKPTNTFRKYKIMIYKKVISLGIPYIIFSFIYVAMQQVGKLAGAGKGTIHQVYSWSTLLRMFAYPISYMWFLYSLLIIFILVGIMDLFHFNPISKTIISVILLLIVPLIHIWSAVSNAFAFMICFQIGWLIKYFLNKYYKEFKKYVRNAKNTFYIFLIWCALLIFQAYFIGINYRTANMTYVDMFTKLLSIIVFFMIFINFHHNWIFRYFDKYGKLTLVIYLVHVPIDSIVRKALLKFGISNAFVLMTLLVIIVWYLSLFVCYLCHKSNVINFLFYPRGYIDKPVMKIKWGRRLLNK